MNAMSLFNGITMIDDGLIEEAQEFRPKKRAPAWVRWGAAAACVCVVAAGAFAWQQHHGRTLPEQFNLNTTAGENSLAEIGADNVLVPRWESLSDAERYLTLDFDGRQYMRGRTRESGAVPGAELGTGALTGWDMETGEQHGMTGTVYAIDGVSTACAVAMRLDNQLYAYVNADYRPATLGQFIDDLNLTETLELGWGVYYWYGSGGGYASEQISDFDARLVWDGLLSHTDAANVENYDQLWFGRKKFSVSVDLPVLGYGNISLWVTEDGYLHTNILETGKGFYIGEDAVRAFLSAVEECYGIDPARLDAPAPRVEGAPENNSVSTAPYDPSGNPAATPAPTVPPNA